MNKIKSLEVGRVERQGPPREDTGEPQVWRRFIADATELFYKTDRKPIWHKLIAECARNRAAALIYQEQWPYRGWVNKNTGKVEGLRELRWIDRRINECARDDEPKQHPEPATIARMGGDGYYVPVDVYREEQKKKRRLTEFMGET